MKRKLWIALIVALLLAALGCVAASADSYSFIRQPLVGTLDVSTKAYPVSWVTSFIPVKVEIVKGSYDGFYFTDTEVYRTLTGDVRPRMDVSIPGTEGGNYFEIRAYYSDSQHIRSDVFTLMPPDPKFIREPVISPWFSGGSYTVSWETSFNPIRVEVLKGSYDGFYFTDPEVYLTFTDLAEANMVISIPGAEGGNQFMIRAYYGDTRSVGSKGFTLKPGYPSFTREPLVGSMNAATKTYPVIWETSFTPYKVEIMEITGSYSAPELVMTLTENLSANGACSIPGAKGGKRFIVYAYYGDSHCVSSQLFDLKPADPTFIREPAAGALTASDHTYPVSWETSFTPYKVEVIKMAEPYSTPEVILSLTENLSAQGSCSVPGAQGGRDIGIRVYYGDSHYIVSSAFCLKPDNPSFAAQSSVTSMNTTNHAYTVAWETSFNPIRVEVRKGHWTTADFFGPYYDYSEVYRTYTSISAQGSCSINSMEGGNHFIIRAYYGDSHYVDCAGFVLEPADTGFTSQPTVGELNVSTRVYPVSWRTGFPPVTVEIYRCEMAWRYNLQTDSMEWQYAPAELVSVMSYQNQRGSWQPSVLYSGQAFMIRAYYGREVWTDSSVFELPECCGVIYNMEGHGNNIGWQRLAYGAVPTRPANPTATGWHFDGWYTSPDYTQTFDFTAPVTGISMVYAKWSRLCSVTFNMNGYGQQTAGQQVPEGRRATRPENPSAAGAVFSGWYTDEACTTLFNFSRAITADTVIHAKWITSYYVYFNPGSGSGSMLGIEVPVNGYLTLPDSAFTSPNGAAFAGWQKNGTGDLLDVGTRVQITAATTFYARWKGPFTVAFDSNGGSGEMNAQRIGYGQTFTLPACGFTEPAGKAFRTWHIMGESLDAGLGPNCQFRVYSDLTVTAEWTGARVDFDANGGSGTLVPASLTPDASGCVTLPDCSLTPPSGRMFAGWDRGAPGTSIEIHGHTVIQAQWTDAAYTVSFDKNGGSGSMSALHITGDTFALPACTFTAPGGKQFAYWIVPAAMTGYKLYYPGQTVQINADTTVKAIWIDEQPSSFTVSFNPGDGTGNMPDITVANGAYLTFPECAFIPPEGKIFEHWILKTVDGYYLGTYNPGDQELIIRDYTVWPYYRDLESHIVYFYNPENYDILSSQVVVEGTPVSVPEVSLPGYTLNGWMFRYRPDENSDWITIPFDFSQPVEYYLALEGDLTSPTISVYGDFTQNEYGLAVNVSDGGTASLDPVKDTYHYGDQLYLSFASQENYYLESAVLVPAEGEPLDLNLSLSFTMPDCDAAINLVFVNQIIDSGTLGDNLYWTLNRYGTLTVSGTGAMPDYSSATVTPFKGDRRITYLIVEPGITHIGSLAFWDCENLTSFTLPEDLQSIGAGAFQGCGLTLAQINLPDTVTTIGADAFAYNPIMEITVPASMTEIPRAAFRNLSSLTTVVLHDGITSIGEDAFYNDSSLTQVTIPAGVTAIGSAAFGNCAQLTRVEGLEHVETMGTSVFYHCPLLTVVSLPPLSGIPSQTFDGCSSLRVISIPGTVRQIGANAFSGCGALEEVYFENSRRVWENEVVLGSGNDSLTGAELYCWPAVTFDPGEGTGSMDTMTVPTSVPVALPECGFTPPTGLSFLHWNLMLDGAVEDSVAAGEEYAFEEDMTAVAVYASVERQLTLLAGEGGTVSADPAQSSYHFGDIITLTVEPDPGLGLESVTLTQGEGTPHALDGLVFTMPDCDVTVEVRFTAVPVSGSVGSLSWMLTPDGQMTVSGTGAMPDFSPLDDVPWKEYRSNIRGLTVEAGVTTVGAWAFAGLTSLSDVSLPATLTGIGNYAFSGCAGLGAAVLPQGLTRIGEGAFESSGLTSVEIPGTVRRIESIAFENCGSLARVTLQAGLEEIGSSAFGSCTALTRVTLPESIRSIDSLAFDSCSALRSVEGLEHVQTLYSSVFSDCDSLTDVTLPDLSIIPGGLFARCTGLTQLTIPTSVTTVEDSAFDECIFLAVYYPGTRAAWEAISVGANNGNLRTAPLYCSHVLRFDPGEGGGSMDSLTISFGEAVALPECAFTPPTGTVFLHWELLSEEGTEGYVSAGETCAFSQDMTARAVWYPMGYELTLTVAEGGTAQLFPAQPVYRYGDEVTVLYTCEDGWEPDCILLTPEGGEPTVLEGSDFTMPDRNATLEVRFTVVGWSGTAGDLTWQLMPDGQMTVRGTGPMPDYASPEGVPWMAYREKIRVLTVEPGVTSIGKWAFANTDSLGTVNLPDTLTLLGDNAFYGCGGLSTVELPQSLTRIGDSAFFLAGLTAVEIPGSVRVIDTSAFDACESLAGLTLHEGLETIGPSAFSCTALTRISLPDSIRSIGSYAFDGCGALVTVDGLENLESLEYGLFCECVSLREVMLPRVARIPGDTFARCRSLDHIGIPDTVTVIEDRAFDECDSLASVFYEGSRSMWNAITIGDFNDALLDAALMCKFTLTFNTCDGPDIIEPILFNWDEIPPRPEYAAPIGAWFAGWYLDDVCETPYDFDVPLNADTTLYAAYVRPQASQTLRLPAALTAVESEAFAGTSPVFILVPRTVTVIAGDAFPATTGYILGYPGSAAETWADAHGIPFIEINDEWMAEH